MKTTPYAPPQASQQLAVSDLRVTSQLKVFTNGKELEFSLFGALYCVITLVRAKQTLQVFSDVGTLLLDYDGSKVRESVPAFEQAVVDFEVFLLNEQRIGFQEAKASQGLQAYPTPAN